MVQNERVNSWNLHAHVYACVRMWVYICMCMFVCSPVHMCVYKCVCVRVCARTHVPVCMLRVYSVCVCVAACVYVYDNIRTHVMYIGRHPVEWTARLRLAQKSQIHGAVFFQVSHS